MIKIDKRTSPSFLHTLQKKGRSYQDLPHSSDEHYIQELRRYLIEEQHGLCGYCCSGITTDNSHNEHMRPQHAHSTQTLAYENIIASCNHANTCGRKKHGDNSPIVYPTSRDCEEQFEFNEFDGSVQGLTDLAEHTIDVLNLNEPSLCMARLNTLYGISWCSYQDVYAQCYQEDMPEWLQYADIVRYVLRKYRTNWEAFQQVFRQLYDRVDE